MRSGRGQRGATGPRLAIGWISIGLAAALLLTVPVGRVGNAPGPVPPGGSAVRALAACTGAHQESWANGTLTEVGNTTPVPSVVGVNLTIVFTEQITVTPTGHPATERCTTSTASGVTGPAGRFALALVLPTGGCDSYGCTEYAGPFSPESAELTDAAPAGYFLSGNLSAAPAHLVLVAAFDRLVIDPAGPKTVSVGDPVPFSARAFAANGAPSPATVTAGWSVVGAGWILSNTSGAETVVTADTNSAGATTLALVANASYAGRPIAALRTSDALNAVATSLDIASATPTRLDAGSSATFTLIGRGAEGYTYTAVVDPGTGGPWSSAPCTATLVAGGEDELDCSVGVPYPTAGSFQPVANLTNGYSTSEWHFLPLVVSSALELTLPPGPVLGYVGVPIALTVGVANATGTSPYGPACLDTGLGTIDCAAGPGPTWAFTLTYPDPGVYPGVLHVQDASGANASRAVPVTVGVPPQVEDLSASGASTPMHTADPLVATVVGGVGPIDFWWNSSALPGSFARGTAASGQTLRATYWANGSSGPETITLSVRDGLGTLVAASAVIYVVPGPAVAIAAVGGVPNATWYAGVGAGFSLEALAPAPDPARVSTYASELDLTLASGPVPAAQLALGSALLGPILPSANGTFVLPVSAWFAGYLNFTLTTERAGAYAFVLASQLPVTFAPHGTLEVSVEADLPALRLVDPVPALAGPRENRTLYHLVDPFGNPAPSGTLYVTASFGGSNSTTASPIHANATAAWAWVNYSAPSDAAGVIVVRTGWGELLLGPIAVPAAPGVLPLLWLSAAALAGVGAVALGVSAIRRRRPAPGGEVAELSPEELRHEAEGRAALLERIRATGPLELDELFDRTGPGAPARAELTEWLASLLTEHQVESTMGADGRPRVRAVDRSALPEAPRVEFDPSVLERGSFDLGATTPAPEEGVEAEPKD